MIKQLLNNLISKLSSKAAFGLILAVFVIAAFTILGATAVSLLTSQTDEATTYLNKTKTLYLALAARDLGLERRLSPWRRVFSGLQETYILGDGQIRLDEINFTSRTATLSYKGFLNTSHPLYGDFSTTLLQDVNSDTTTTQTLQNYQGLFNYSGAVILKDWGTCGSSGVYRKTRLYGNVYFGATSLRFTDTNNANYPDGARLGDTTYQTNNFYTNGSLNVATNFVSPNYGIHGSAYAGSTISGVAQISGTPNQNQPASTWPTIPTLTTTYYTNLINLASNTNPAFSYQGTLTYSVNPTDLNGSTVFVNGDVVINYGVNIRSSSGQPAYIIAKNNIKVNSRAVIEEKISLIAGGQVTIDQDWSAPLTIVGGTYQATGDLVDGAGALIYSGGQMNLFTYGSGAYGLFKGYFLTPNGVYTNWPANGKLFGILYANSLSGSGWSSCFRCAPCSDAVYGSTSYESAKVYGNIIINNNGSGYMTINELHPYSQAGYSSPNDTYIPLNLPGLIEPTKSTLRFQ